MVKVKLLVVPGYSNNGCSAKTKEQVQYTLIVTMLHNCNLQQLVQH